MSIIDDLFNQPEDANGADSGFIGYPKHVVACPQGVVTYVVPHKSLAAHLLSHFNKERAEKAIRDILAACPDTTVDELREEMTTFFVFVISLRKSGRSANAGDVIVGRISDGEPTDDSNEPYRPGSIGELLAKKKRNE
jgi:hypothetical protein